MSIFTKIITALILAFVILGSAYVSMILSAAWLPTPTGFVAFSVAFSLALGLLFARILFGSFRKPRVLRNALIGSASISLMWGLLLIGWIFRPLQGTNPSTPQEQTEAQHITVQGLHLALRHYTPDSVAFPFTVVYLHPGPGNFGTENTSVDRLMRALASYGMQGLVYDRPGEGLSQRLEDPSGYTPELQLQVLDALLRGLPTGKAVLLGDSYGARLGVRYAAAHPGRVAGLVLLSPGPLYTNPWDPFKVSLYTRLSQDQKKEVNKLRTNARILTAHLLSQRNALAGRRFLPDAEADPYFSSMFRELSPGGLCDPNDTNYAYGNCGFWSSLWTDRREYGDTIAVPVLRDSIPALALRGTCDYLPERVMRPYFRVLPFLKAELLMDRGHLMVHEDPEGLAARIAIFLGEGK